MKNIKNKFGVFGTIFFFILTNIKYGLVLLKWSKFGGTFITLFVSLVAYAIVYGWKFGVAIIYLLLIHEIGHYVTAKILKINTSPIFFIPFLGAVINMKNQPKNAKIEAIMAYGGPLAGLISIVPAIILFSITKEPLWILIFTMGAFLNLFNLMPISPLDGGRIIGAVSPKIWFIGIIFLFVYVCFKPNGILFLILFFGVMTLIDTFKKDRNVKVFSAIMENNLQFHNEMLSFKNEIENMVNEENKKYTINIKVQKINERLQIVNRKYNNQKKSWFIPYKDDNKYVDLECTSNEIDNLKNLLSSLRIFNGYLIEGLISKIEKSNQEIQKIIQETKGYFLTSKKDKVLVLLAYVSLALILLIIYEHGTNLMNIYKLK